MAHELLGLGETISSIIDSFRLVKNCVHLRCMQTKTLTIGKKLDALANDLYDLRVEFYRSLPEVKRRDLPIYAQEALMRAVGGVREQIWQKRYVKRLSRIS